MGWLVSHDLSFLVIFTCSDFLRRGFFTEGYDKLTSDYYVYQTKDLYILNTFCIAAKIFLFISNDVLCTFNTRVTVIICISCL